MGDPRQPDPTPLRYRLGPRAESFWQPPDEDATETEWLPPDPTIDLTLDADEDDETFLDPEIADEPATAEPANADPATTVTPIGPGAWPHTPAWSKQLERARLDTDQRVDRWVADQQQRLLAGLDLLLAQLNERREQEAARLEEWMISERQRARSELDQEQERFRARLMAELVAFEEQLGLRLCEQEERLARWWSEAEQLAQKRFADVGLSATQGIEPPRS